MNLLTIFDLEKGDIDRLIERAASLKERQRRRNTPSVTRWEGTSPHLREALYKDPCLL